MTGNGSQSHSAHSALKHSRPADCQDWDVLTKMNGDAFSTPCERFCFCTSREGEGVYESQIGSLGVAEDCQVVSCSVADQ